MPPRAVRRRSLGCSIARWPWRRRRRAARSLPTASKTAVVCGRVPGHGATASPMPSALQRLCLHAQRFTSLVSIELPNALLLEIRGSVKLFGSLERAACGHRCRWCRLALAARSATAPSTLAALWLARAGKRVAHRRSRTARGSIWRSCPWLARLGMRSGCKPCAPWASRGSGELLRLPRAGMARRFGPPACSIWILHWRGKRRRAAHSCARERFRERCDFETEIETVAYLEKALEPLIERCARFLRERQAGVQALRIEAEASGRAGHAGALGLASITSERRRLTRCAVPKTVPARTCARRFEAWNSLSGSLRPLSASFSRCLRRIQGGGGRDTRAAIGGALARAAGRGSGVWRLPDSGTSARGGLAAGA